MSNDLLKNVAELNDSVKNYFQTKVELVKLSLLEKTTRIISYLLRFQILMLFVFLIISFGAVAFAVWYGQTYDNLVTGLLIVCVCLIILALFFILFGKKIINTVLIKRFSEIMFEEDEKLD